MEILFILLMITVYAVHGIFLSFYNRRYPGEEKNKNFVYSAMLGILVAAITFAVSGFTFDFSATSLILGFLNGFAVVAYNYFLGKGAELGSYSFVIMSSISGGILLPLAVSVCFDGFPGVFKIIGIAVMFAAFFLLCVDFSGKNKTKAQKGFYLTCICLAVANGSFGIINALEDRFEGGVHNTEFIIVTYVTASLLTFTVLLFKNRRATLSAFRQLPTSALFAVLGAGSIAAGINLLMLCLKYVNEATLYTVQNGGVLMLSAFLSLIIFKEKITLQKWVGIIVAAVGMVLLAL